MHLENKIDKFIAYFYLAIAMGCIFFVGYSQDVIIGIICAFSGGIFFLLFYLQLKKIY
jgi:hypothetical protein